MNNLKTLQLDEIRIDGGTQPRASIDQELLSEYADAMQAGDIFPPVTVFYDGVHHWLADGFHRYWANQKIGANKLEAEIRHGTQRDAVLFSVGANAAHGGRRTNEDKRRAVLTLLKDEEWGKWSDTEIARRANVNQSTVTRIRHDVSLMQSISDPTTQERTYTNKHGKQSTMRTGNIGKARTTAAPEEDHIDPGIESEPTSTQREDVKAKTSKPGKGVMLANEAINCLMRIPKNDPLRKRGFQIVTDWIRHNK